MRRLVRKHHDLCANLLDFHKPPLFETNFISVRFVVRLGGAQ